jgi:hypothetical protein
MNTVGDRRAVAAACVWSCLSGGVVGLLATPVVRAQPPSGAPTNGPVLLVVRPRVGDTLRLQVEQSVTVRARRGDASAPAIANPGAERPARGSVPEYGPRADRARLTRVQLFAHSFVESSDLQRTTLMATTDSIAMWVGTPTSVSTTADADDPAWQRMPLADDARRVRVQVTPDGAMRMADPPPGARDLGATLGSLPGLLPEGPVRTGTLWRREFPLPSLPLTGYHTDGVVQAELRLDSLTRGGREAWISLTGRLRRDGAARELPPGTRVITAGTIRGSMRVDRVRAWIMDATTEMDVVSEVVPGPAARTAPMLLDLRIEQRLRVR